jgi:hypothetical protein
MTMRSMPPACAYAAILIELAFCFRHQTVSKLGEFGRVVIDDVEHDVPHRSYRSQPEGYSLLRSLLAAAAHCNGDRQRNGTDPTSKRRVHICGSFPTVVSTR